MVFSKQPWTPLPLSSQNSLTNIFYQIIWGGWKFLKAKFVWQIFLKPFTPFKFCKLSQVWIHFFLDVWKGILLLKYLKQSRALGVQDFIDQYFLQKQLRYLKSFEGKILFMINLKRDIHSAVPDHIWRRAEPGFSIAGQCVLLQKMFDFFLNSKNYHMSNILIGILLNP